MQAMDLVCLGYNPWSAMWKRNQTLVAGLSRQAWIRRVLFLNPEVWVGALLRSPGRHLSGFGRSYWRGSLRPFRAGPKTDVYTVCHWPFAGWSPRIGGVQRRVVERVVAPYTAHPYVLLVNRPADPGSPLVARLFDGAHLAVFDWSDDFEEFARGEAERTEVRRRCEFFLSSSDLVLAVNARLARRALAFQPSVRLLRNATHYEVLARAAEPGAAVAPSMRRIPRPVIGYVGWLNDARLDHGLLEAVAQARPSVSLVFLGPRSSARPLGDRLPRARNVHVLPPVPYEALPGYLAAFDVCMLPNRLNAHTDGNDPLKLYDYLATGKPIVATRTAGTEGLEEVVRLADDGAGFVEAVDAALGERSDALRARRQELAREHSWEARVREVAAAVGAMLGTADRVPEATAAAPLPG